jgi:hypothetical protein
MMSLLTAFGSALTVLIVCAVFIAILSVIPAWASAALSLLLSLMLPAGYVFMGLLLPFPWNLGAFAIAGVLLWWPVRPMLREFIACLRPPAEPTAGAPAGAPGRAAWSTAEIRLFRREIVVDCVILVGMMTARYATEIDGYLDGYLRLVPVAVGLAGLIVNAVIFARLKDRARWVATVMERAGLDALAQPPSSEIAMQLMLSDRSIYPAGESDLVCIEHEDFAILSNGDTFIQCAGPSHGANKSGHGYLLEYQDGSEDRHYRAADEPITLARVLFAFLKYLRGDASFRTDFRWEKVELERWNPEASRPCDS